MASPAIQSFPIAADDPLADEHRAVAAWVEESASSEGDFYRTVPLKSFSSGRQFLDAKPEQARRYVLAAVAQTRFWEAEAERIRGGAETDALYINLSVLPGWGLLWGRRRKAEAVVSELMRRALPLQKQDLIELLRWCNSSPNLNTIHAPLGAITRALERFAGENAIDDELRQVFKEFAARLRSSHDKKAKQLGTAVEQLCPDDDTVASHTSSPTDRKPHPHPAPAGTPGVLEELKRRLGMMPGDAEPAAMIREPDRFPLPANSPFPLEHELLGEMFHELVGQPGYQAPNLKDLEAGRRILRMTPEESGAVLLAAAERHVHALLAPADYTEHAVWQSRYAAMGCMAPLAHLNFRVTREGAFDLLLYLSTRPAHEHAALQFAPKLVKQIEQDAAAALLTEGERYVLSLYRASLISGPPLGTASDEVARLTEWIGDGAGFLLVPGEVWTDAVNDDFSSMPPAERRSWAALFTHALTATSSRPSAKWLKTADKCVSDLNGERVREALDRWFPLVTQGRSIGKLGQYAGDARGAANTMEEENATCLRGLLWMAPTLPRPEELARQIAGVALTAYKKVPGVGPRAVKVGNAAVYALSQIATTEAVGQLAMLKVRVKSGSAQKEIEKAFMASAEALGLPREEIEELGVPSYGLEELGRREETFGDYRAELLVTGADAQLRWFDPKGKALKSVPAKVKQEHKDDLKELQQSLKDIQGMLPAQRDRIDGMFLLQKSWPIDAWRERYLNHPLVGTIAQRLLWCVDGTAAIFLDGEAKDIEGNPIAHGKTAEITLWHPVGRSIEEITAWRRRLEELGVTQPFKQAHREVYLLTDAERNTRTYSNRYAAHIIRQHQFNALCAARGWKNKLRLMVDDTYPPATKELPQWELRAEFWIEGIGEDYGHDTNESGVYLRLATDQVRFYRSEAATSLAHAGGGGYRSRAAGPGQANINDPLPLEEIPPLVFSEVMRDVDLFVGVASVGNDPTWQDGGPEGRYRDYWQSYSFGELSGTAATRKQVLERLVPRLKIADRCSISDRFLIVRGDKRTYKIHLGSGNILMEPNDQYLCIVPDSRSRSKENDLFLPFEGDGTLSIIISKAFLLAEDTKIKDPTITRQIDPR
jgi:hypothetical protein